MRSRREKILASSLGNVLKGAVAPVQEDSVVLLVLGRLEPLDAIVDVRVGSEKVLPAVIVEIEHADSPSAVLSALDRHAARVGRILEQSRPCIPNKRKGFAGQRVKSDVGQSIVIVVPEVHAHPRDWVAGVEQSRSNLQSDLFEFAVSEVVKQEVRHLVIGNENIHEAVAIVVSDLVRIGRPG